MKSIAFVVITLIMGFVCLQWVDWMAGALILAAGLVAGAMVIKERLGKPK